MPLINPQRGIFKPQRMRYLLSIRTVFPKPGAKVWYDDQRSVHQQIYQSVDSVEYAFMGTDPAAADNRWLREAMDAGVPVIYFVGVSPGKYMFFPTRITAWDGAALKARVSFQMPTSEVAGTADAAAERRYAMRLWIDRDRLNLHARPVSRYEGPILVPCRHRLLPPPISAVFYRHFTFLSLSRYKTSR